MKTERKFGHIQGIYEGDIFKNRIILSISKIHKPIQAGISGSETEGSDSIVISGGYEDDKDLGRTIIYTGHGGRSNESKVQVADQTLTRGNKALAISCEKQLPVRDIRGANRHSEYAPESGYRYDGLFLVEEYWREKGKSGLEIWRFRLVKIEEDIMLESQNILNEPEFKYENSERRQYVINRIIRETKIAQYIKDLYENKCQICQIQIKTPVGFYSEAAHIKGLGKPHNGPDTKENILCLCPNHHTMFDLGIITINDDFSIVGLENQFLFVIQKHNINIEYLKYHREHHYKEL